MQAGVVPSTAVAAVIVNEMVNSKISFISILCAYTGGLFCLFSHKNNEK